MTKSKNEGGLGFRDIRSFNLEMLAKQNWRLLQNPNSLPSKIFKKKYFSGVEFLEANVGKRPSQVWKSVMAGKSLMKQWLVWRICDGKKVKIWHDKWIPIPRTHKIQSPVTLIDAEAKVSELIDDNSRWLNENLSKPFSRSKKVKPLNVFLLAK